MTYKKVDKRIYNKKSKKNIENKVKHERISITNRRKRKKRE